ncbi:MAG TPA: tetratricopeptide repeat protein [Syntrophales bacterium]
MNKKLKQAMELISRGKMTEARKSLEKLEKLEPNNSDVLYNLGMIYSDTGNYNAAIERLQRCLKISPTHVNAQVALGLAYLRSGDSNKAETHFLETLGKDPENIYALQNLGGLYAKQKRFDEAISIFEGGERFAPNHPNFLYGLALIYQDLGRLKESDIYYRKLLDRDLEDQFTELARKGLSEIAFSGFKNRVPRMDAIMYCLAALEKFSRMEYSNAREVTSEIAILGRSGLDINDPSRTYNLTSLPGDFTGLQLVCYMYVGFKMIEPSMDIGFDLSNEYETAKALFSKKGKNEEGTILRETLH